MTLTCAASSAEVNLLYAYKQLVIPIEIKSGSTGTLKSLHQFIEAADHPYTSIGIKKNFFMILVFIVNTLKYTEN